MYSLSLYSLPDSESEFNFRGGVNLFTAGRVLTAKKIEIISFDSTQCHLNLNSINRFVQLVSLTFNLLAISRLFTFYPDQNYDEKLCIFWMSKNYDHAI